MSEKKKKGMVLIGDVLLAAALLWLDQFTKRLATEKLRGKNPFVMISGVFELDYLENRGSAFGMFQDRKVFLLCVGVIFLAIMLYLLFRTPPQKKYLVIHMVFSAIIAGGLGNMIDRFRLGYVVDFFSFVWIHFPVFNVADMYITISVALMILLLFFVYREDELDFLSLK